MAKPPPDAAASEPTAPHGFPAGIPADVARLLDAGLRRSSPSSDRLRDETPAFLARVDPVAAVEFTLSDRVPRDRRRLYLSEVVDVVADDVEAIHDVVRAVPEGHPLRGAVALDAARAVARIDPDAARTLFAEAERRRRDPRLPDADRTALTFETAPWIAAASDDRARRRLGRLHGGDGESRWASLAEAIRPSEEGAAARMIDEAIGTEADGSPDASAIAVVDPDRAAALVRSGPDATDRCLGLTRIAQICDDPDDARRLLLEAEGLIDRVATGHRRWSADAVVIAWAAVDPERAERLLTAPLDGRPLAARVSAEVAATIARTDPDRAVRLAMAAPAAAAAAVAEALAPISSAHAESVGHSLVGAEHWIFKVDDLVEILAPIDARAAERLYDRLPADEVHEDSLRALVTAHAENDPDRAERFTRAAPDDTYDLAVVVECLAIVAQAVATTDPPRSRRLLAEATRVTREAPDSAFEPAECRIALGRIAATLDPPLAAEMLTEAEPFVRAVEDRYAASRTAQLAGLAAAWTTLDPARAEPIVESLRDDWRWVDLVLDLAEALARRHGIPVRDPSA